MRHRQPSMLTGLNSMTYSSIGSIASENFSKLAQSVPLSVFLIWTLIASQMSRALSTSIYDTCALRRKDTTSRPTTSIKYLITSVVGYPWVVGWVGGVNRDDGRMVAPLEPETPLAVLPD